VNTGAITARARTVKVSVVLLWLVTGVFYAPGWVAGRVWFCIAWAGCAVADGFTAGARPQSGPPG
jgi:hypothetical protein